MKEIGNEVMKQFSDLTLNVGKFNNNFHDAVRFDCLISSFSIRVKFKAKGYN